MIIDDPEEIKKIGRSFENKAGKQGCIDLTSDTNSPSVSSNSTL